MDTQNSTITQFLHGHDKRFIVPFYQRDYAWTRKNCQKLWDDLQDIIKNNRSDHFLGTVVTVNDGGSKFLIIDGQQRITTFSILLIALHNFLKNKKDISEYENEVKRTLFEYLIDKFSKNKETRIRLKPNKKDIQYFNHLFEEDISNIEKTDSNITSNYQFFYSKFSNNNSLAIEEIFNALNKLKIVWITLKEDENPQLIFESLNSTGVKLTASDLIRNYILMNLKPDLQEQFCQKYWLAIEEATSEEQVSDVSNFIRIYLIFKQKSRVSKDEIYEEFKKFVEKNFSNNQSNDVNKEDLLKDLLKFAKIYEFLIQKKDFENDKINFLLKKLKRLEFTVAQPFLLDVFNDLNSQILTPEDVTNILKTIESYVFRKLIVDNTTQGLNKLFITISKEIKKEPNWQIGYVDIFNHILLEKTTISGRFPSDEDFENALITKDISSKRKNLNFLLRELENHNSAYKIENIEDLEVEHIMPQSLSDKKDRNWKSSLGETWQEIHKKYLHTLGNLSLAAKDQNIKMSNHSYPNKQKIDYQSSKLKLNYRLSGDEKWNEESIIKRAKELAKEAKEIWIYPKSNYQKNVSTDSFDLTSEEDNFTHKKPLNLYFERDFADDEKIIKVKSWQDFIREICTFLYKYSPIDFNEAQKSQKLSKYLKNDCKGLRKPIEFADGKFVEGTLTAKDSVKTAREICDQIGYSPEKILFDLKKD